MVKDAKILREFESKIENLLFGDFKGRLLLFDSMLELKKVLVPVWDPLEGLNKKILFIRKLHSAK